MLKHALTIAGSDSDGMAGVQADLKTFEHFRVHGLSVITAITAQAPDKVISTHAVPIQSVEDQLDAIFSSFNVDGIKTGMLYSADIVASIVRKLTAYKGLLIVDPVMIAGSGARLLLEDAVRPLIESLLPLATLVMPNIHEAEHITDTEIRSIEEMESATRKMADMGMKNIIIKGSHLNGEKITDLLYHEQHFHLHEKARMDASAHGTGCIFSSALLASLIQGSKLSSAFHRAEEYVTGIMRERALLKNARTKELRAEFEQASACLEAAKSFCKLIPEVRSNLALGPEKMQSLSEILTTEGRITRSFGFPKVIGPLELGGVHHVPRLLLAAHKFDDSIRAAINIRFDERHVVACQRANLEVVELDRQQEPPDNIQKEGGTMEWVIEETYRKHKKIPDVIFDRGDLKKEPMIRVFARNAMDVVNKIQKIMSFL